jgi:uncharacterized protein YjiS (DUF1127 family)
MTIAQQQNIVLSRQRFMPAAATITLWLRRARTRADLRELDAHRLADIGVTEAERARECAKWFWQK